MPPKKGGKKGGKKKGDDTEPPHDASWERAVESGKWEKPATDLPDANTWPTWGALRERVLVSCKEINVLNTASLRDAFCNEIVKLSPPELTSIDFSGSTNLRNFVMSPITSCPKLDILNLSSCSSLEYVMVQSDSLSTLVIENCEKLNKVLIHCPKLKEIAITGNTNLETIMLWSEDLMALDLTGCTNIYNLKLQCPALTEQKCPPLKYIEPHIKPSHPPISMMLKETLTVAASEAVEAKEREWKSMKEESVIPAVHRPF